VLSCAAPVPASTWHAVVLVTEAKPGKTVKGTPTVRVKAAVVKKIYITSTVYNGDIVSFSDGQCVLGGRRVAPLEFWKPGRLAHVYGKFFVANARHDGSTFGRIKRIADGRVTIDAWTADGRRDVEIPLAADCRVLVGGKAADREALRPDCEIQLIPAAPQRVEAFTAPPPRWEQPVSSRHGSQPTGDFDGAVVQSVETGENARGRHVMTVTLKGPRQAGIEEFSYSFAPDQKAIVDGRLGALSDLAKPGRVLAGMSKRGGTNPTWLCGDTDQDEQVAGTVVSAGEGGAVIAVERLGEEQERKVSVAPDATFTLDHRPATRAEVLVPGRRVRILAPMVQTVLVHPVAAAGATVEELVAALPEQSTKDPYRASRLLGWRLRDNADALLPVVCGQIEKCAEERSKGVLHDLLCELRLLPAPADAALRDRLAKAVARSLGKAGPVDGFLAADLLRRWGPKASAARPVLEGEIRKLWDAGKIKKARYDLDEVIAAIVGKAADGGAEK